MNLTIFFLQPFSFKKKRDCPCPREFKKSTLKEESAVAKPRPVNLVSKNLLSVKNDPQQDLSDPNSLGNQELDQSRFSSRQAFFFKKS